MADQIGICGKEFLDCYCVLPPHSDTFHHRSKDGTVWWSYTMEDYKQAWPKIFSLREEETRALIAALNFTKSRSAMWEPIDDHLLRRLEDLL